MDTKSLLSLALSALRLDEQARNELNDVFEENDVPKFDGIWVVIDDSGITPYFSEREALLGSLYDLEQAYELFVYYPSDFYKDLADKFWELENKEEVNFKDYLPTLPLEVLRDLVKGYHFEEFYLCEKLTIPMNEEDE